MLKKLEEQEKRNLNNINRLNEGKIDLDYLDELARTKLNYANPKETVIIYNDKKDVQ